MNTNEGEQTLPPQYPAQYPALPAQPVAPAYAGQAVYPPQVQNPNIHYPQQYIQPSQPPQQPQHVVYIHEAVHNPQEENHTDVAPILYCSCCILFFVPFGWVFAIAASCWFTRLRRPKTERELRAYKVLQVCMVINIIFTLLLIIYS